MSKLFATVGERYGRWLVTGEVVWNAKGERCVPCRCEGTPERPCGTERLVVLKSLTSGRSRSCGCLDREVIATRNRILKRTHGESHRGGQGPTPEYLSWAGMKTRCTNPKTPDWKNYGGRGIRICDRWLGPDGFANFLADMGRRPSSDHTLDRHPDPNGDYAPGNCRWATKKQQARNNRRVRRWTVNGETHCPGEWVEITGLPWSTLDQRSRHGCPPERLLEPRFVARLTVEIDGLPHLLADLARGAGLPYTAVWKRWRRGCPPERLLKPLKR